MKKEFTLFIIILFCGALQGQSSSSDPLNIPNYEPKSPEVANFTKYGDIPVSEYTGIPNISIPIHVVKSGELSLPIKLNYQASGIQVGQEATLVGLGWNLIAGGAITYSPVGGNDQINPVTSFLWSDRTRLLNYIKTGVGDPILGGRGTEDQYIGWTCGFFPGPPNPYVTGPGITAGLKGQGQLDIYNVNFLNYSFKFFIHPGTNKPVIIGKNNKCLINKSGDIFIITGEDGVEYFFGTNAREFSNQSGNPCINAWYLTQILSIDGHSITLKYNNFGTTENIEAMSERYGVNFPKCYPQEILKRNFNTTTSISNMYLNSIETSNEIVSFSMDSNRIDITGHARRLRAIKVLDKISNTEIMRDSLNYDYFTGSNVGGDYMTDDTFHNYPTNQNLLSKRLKLIKLTRYDNKATKGEEYIFEYNNSIALPLKTSFARDYWGYYNGQENSSTLMPNSAKHTLLPNIFDLTLQNSDYLSIPDSVLLIKGAIRGASVKNITAGMLQSITYPTGGKTVFQFEPNTFTNETYISAECRDSLFTYCPYFAFYNNPTASAAYNTVPFTINRRTSVHFTGTIQGNTGNQPYTYDQLSGCNIVIVNTANGNLVLHNLPNSSDAVSFAANGFTKSWDETIYLDAGNYKLICSVPGTLGYWGYSNLVSANLSYYNFNASVLPKAIPTGGGVRVKTITDYDTNNNVTLSKQYVYNGGKLLIPLNYMRTRTLYGAEIDGRVGGCYFNNTYILSSDSYNESAYTGIYVGYDQVQITNLSDGKSNGKEIIRFQNTLPKNTVTDYPAFEYCYTNGDVLNRTLMNASNDTVRTENNTYASSDFYREFINFLVEDNYVGPSDYCFNTLGGVPMNYKAYIGRYSIIEFSNTSIWSYLHSIETTDYLNGSKIITKKEFTYNPLNYCPSEIKVTNSDNKIKYTRNTYSVDYGIEPYSTMVYSFNIINPVIEQKEYVGTEFQQSTLTTYDKFGVSSYSGYPIFKPYLIQTKVKPETSDYITRIKFENYDGLGNLLYSTKDDASTKLVYFWGYNNTYPVAKIENATLDQAKEVFGGTLPNLGSGGLSDVQNNSIRIGLPQAMVSTFTFKPLVGVATVTNPRGVTTTYNYDDFGRLNEFYIMLNGVKQTIKSYQYNFKH